MSDTPSCPHTDTVPVEVRDHRSGRTEIAARICSSCLDRLPAAWGCGDCEWAEVRRLCDRDGRLVLTAPCKEHAS